MQKLKMSVAALFLVLFCFPILAFADNPLIYDFANVIPDSEEAELESFAREYTNKWETDFVLLTVNSLEGKSIKDYQGDFHDENELGYDKPFGNVAMFTIDLESREFYLSGYKKAEDYLSDSRLNKIRDDIIPYLKKGEYSEAYQVFVEKADGYMNSRPEFYFQTWFHLIAAVIAGAAVVGIMLANTGGKVTINDRTYLDTSRSKVLARRDTYVRKTVTKRRKPSNKSGGGGITKGGSSFSGSKGRF